MSETEVVKAENNLSMITRAEIDAQIATAKAYPRDIKRVIEEATLMATMDQETAESCIYCLMRTSSDGKTEIKGPSIRLAEIMMSAWGNIHAATRIKDNDGKFITVESVVWDMEKNVKMSAEVPRSIMTSEKVIKGKKIPARTYSIDMQQVVANAASSIALRNAVFKVLPRAFTNKIYAEAVKKAIGDQTTLNERRQNAISYFAKMGIEKDIILKRLECNSINDITLDHLETLLGLRNAIKDGAITIETAFNINKNEAVEREEVSDLNERIYGQAKEAAPEKLFLEAAKDALKDTQDILYLELKRKISEAKTPDEAINAIDRVRTSDISEEQKDELSAFFKEKKKELDSIT